MNRSLRFRARWVLLVLVSTCGFALATPAAQARTQRIADLGFRPEANGFSFQNYGNDDKPVNLTPVQMQWLFGKAVCVSGAWSTCVLKPAAKRWMTTQNQYMSYGHCEGMSVTSLLLFSGIIRPDAFGVSAVDSMRLSRLRDLQSYLAYGYAFQALDSVQEKLIWDADPMGVVRKLAKRLRNGEKGWTIHIFMPDGSGGHAITPLAVDALGGKRYAIRVYDNNWPDQVRTIRVDGRKNTWRYTAAANPKDKAALYTDDADTQTLQLEDLSPGLGEQPCPFCKTKAKARGARARAAQTPGDRVLVALGGNARRGRHSRLLIKDERGRRVSHRTNTIPGAKVERMTSGAIEPWRNDAEPQYDLPAGDLDVAVQDGGSRGAPESLSLLRSGTSVGIDNMTAPGSSVTVPEDLDGVTFKAAPGATQSPSLTLGAEGANGGAVEFKVTAKELASGQSVGVSVSGGKLEIEPPKQGSAVVALEVERSAPNGQQDRFANDAVPLTAGQPASVDVGAWQGNGAAVTVTSGGTTTTVANQAPAPTPPAATPVPPAPTPPAPAATTATAEQPPATPPTAQSPKAAYRQAVTETPGLVAFFPLDGDLVETLTGAPGLTAHGAALPTSGGVWDDGHASFDGTDDDLALPGFPFYDGNGDGTDFTWEGWVRWDGPPHGLTYSRIFDFGSDTGTYMFLSIDPDSTDTPIVEFSYGGDRQRSPYWSRPFPVGEWHHVAVTGDDGFVTSYLDGEEVSSFSTSYVPGDLQTATNNWLGRSQFAVDGFFAGDQQAVALYTTALTREQIAAHVAAAKR